MKNYYIADIHFGHKAILRYDHWPFYDLEQMEEAMVMSWNYSVHKDDTIYILGDFCWGKANEWIRILRRLKGQKVLIQGNHDLKTYPDELRAMFVDITPYAEIQDGERCRRVILSHYPILFYHRSNDPDTYMLHGHVHTTPENDYLEQFKAILRTASSGTTGVHTVNLAQIYNVGCMMPWMNYTPRTLDEIIRNYAVYTKE